jgi:hypothetical protein
MKNSQVVAEDVKKRAVQRPKTGRARLQSQGAPGQCALGLSCPAETISPPSNTDIMLGIRSDYPLPNFQNNR